MIKTICFFGFFIFSSFAYANDYPLEWWAPVDEHSAPGWEILPQSAKKNEVILSKRTELGVFSNLAYTPFVLDGQSYSSIEGLWQGMKYPDSNLDQDPRGQVAGWKNSRAEVFQMHGWESKSAGNFANEMYANYNFQFINYFNRTFNYTDGKSGSQFHLELITRAMREKIKQNPALETLLLKTKGLILKPDHRMSEKALPSFKYHEILMKIRDE